MTQYNHYFHATPHERKSDAVQDGLQSPLCIHENGHDAIQAAVLCRQNALGSSVGYGNPREPKPIDGGFHSYVTAPNTGAPATARSNSWNVFSEVPVFPPICSAPCPR
jgi:hypothetical protein